MTASPVILILSFLSLDLIIVSKRYFPLLLLSKTTISAINFSLGYTTEQKFNSCFKYIVPWPGNSLPNIREKILPGWPRFVIIIFSLCVFLSRDRHPR